PDHRGGVLGSWWWFQSSERRGCGRDQRRGGAMKAARYLAPGELVIEEVDVPALSDGDVLVRMRACGVCGTDVKTYLRGHPMIQPGSVLGHEVAGEVVDSRHPKFSAGQRVALGPYAPCGECGA